MANGTTSLFIKRMFKDPRGVGAVLPSSRFLVNKMMNEIDFENCKVIVEIGPGSGVFTRALIKRKKEDTKLIVIERDPGFAKYLKESCPEAIIINDCASKLTAYLKEMGIESADAVVSGLPFVCIPQKIRTGIFEGIRDALKEKGRFVAFQYSNIVKKEIVRYFDIVKTRFTLLNVPPALVYVCAKKG